MCFLGPCIRLTPKLVLKEKILISVFKGWDFKNSDCWPNGDLFYEKWQKLLTIGVNNGHRVFFTQKSATKCNFSHVFRRITSLLTVFTQKLCKFTEYDQFFPRKSHFSRENREKNQEFQILGVGINKDFWPKYLPLILLYHLFTTVITIFLEMVL